MWAYKVEMLGVISVVLAASRGRAVAATFRSAKEAGYNPNYTEARATRAPEYDWMRDPLPCSRKFRTGTPYSLDYVEKPCNCTICDSARKCDAVCA